MVEPSMTGTFQFTLPQELLSESNRTPPRPPQDTLRVEGWRSSWLSRLPEFFVGKD